MRGRQNRDQPPYCFILYDIFCVHRDECSLWSVPSAPMCLWIKLHFQDWGCRNMSFCVMTARPTMCRGATDECSGVLFVFCPSAHCICGTYFPPLSHLSHLETHTCKRSLKYFTDDHDDSVCFLLSLLSLKHQLNVLFQHDYCLWWWREKMEIISVCRSVCTFTISVNIQV